jgi:trans-aconitate methyltransferase
VTGSVDGHPGVLHTGDARPGAASSPAAVSSARSADDARLRDRLLTLLAEAQWRADLDVLLRSPEWQAATTVLDLGAGNGEFGRRLAARFPLKSIVGLEPDAELHALGAKTASPPNYALVRGRFDQGLAGYFDVLLGRGVLEHLTERRELARWAGKHCRAALIMNNAPEATALQPALPAHAEVFARTDWGHPADREAAQRNRELVDAPRLFADAGFALAGSTLAITKLSEARGRILAHHLLRAMLEMVDAPAVRLDALDELFEWSHQDDACLTLGATWFRFRNTRAATPSLAGG